MPSHHCEKRKYETLDYPGSKANEKTLLTGIRGVDCEKNVYISGFYVPVNQNKTTAFVYKGTLGGKGKFYDLNYPKVNCTPTITNLYGPNNGKKCDTINVVGNYTVQGQTGTIGCLYQGKLDNSGKWTTIIPPFGTILNTICHSTMGHLVVGNYDTVLVQGKAFIYDIKSKQYYDIINVNAISITAYGIWQNSKHCYTICGGYTTGSGSNVGYVVDWNNKKHKLYNWRTYSYGNNSSVAKITHFDGITIGKNEHTYNLTGVWVSSNNDVLDLAFYAEIKRECDGKFKKHAKWCPISYPCKLVTTGNTVYKDTVLGVYTQIEDSTVNGFVSKVKKMLT